MGTELLVLFRAPDKLRVTDSCGHSGLSLITRIKIKCYQKMKLTGI